LLQDENILVKCNLRYNSVIVAMIFYWICLKHIGPKKANLPKILCETISAARVDENLEPLYETDSANCANARRALQVQLKAQRRTQTRMCKALIGKDDVEQMTE